MTRANPTYDTSKKDENDRFSMAASRTTSSELLENFSVHNLTGAIETALSVSDTILGIDPTSFQNHEPEAPGIMTQLMLWKEGESTLQIFLDNAEAMKSSAAKTLNAQQNLLRRASRLAQVVLFILWIG